jgi:hypothetical protein
LLHNHPHLSSEAGTIGQKWPQYKGLSPTPLAIKKILSLSYNYHGDLIFEASVPGSSTLSS